MNAESDALAKAWFAKSEGDLAVAKILIYGSEPHRDSGVYHCQQAAEKAIKALLTRDQSPFPKSHNLRTLLDLAISSHPELAALEGDCLLLTPYATEFRYPGDLFDPAADEAAEALNMATRIVQAASQLLATAND